MHCKQAELRPDLSYNSSRNRSRPTLPSDPPHTRAWGEQWAAGHSPQLLRAWRRRGERDRREGCWVGERKVEVGSVCLGFRQNLSEKRWGWWGERDHRSGFEYINRSNAKCERGKSKCMWRSAGSGSSASVRCRLLRQTPTPRCHSSRPSILRVKEIQLDELYPNYYWLISVVRRFAGGKILRHSCPRGAGSSKPVLWIIKPWQNSNGPFWNSCLISALDRAAEVFLKNDWSLVASIMM